MSVLSFCLFQTLTVVLYHKKQRSVTKILVCGKKLVAAIPRTRKITPAYPAWWSAFGAALSFWNPACRTWRWFTATLFPNIDLVSLCGFT
ncbi:MAG: hypothetical protein IIX86_05270, partial [Clostridia bacterium]|nr:hypothetical protein [Clostridia bacterium]